MYCKYCGKPISEDSIYCKYCGRFLNNEDINMSLDNVLLESNKDKPQPVKHKNSFKVDFNNNKKKIVDFLLLIIGSIVYIFRVEAIFTFIESLYDKIKLQIPKLLDEYYGFGCLISLVLGIILFYSYAIYYSLLISLAIIYYTCIWPYLMALIYISAFVYTVIYRIVI